MKHFSLGTRGFTLIEVIIGALISVTVISGGLNFYSNMHGAVLSQIDISELQHRGRTTLDEISRNLRTAGFRLPAGHPPYEITGDSLVVYGRGTQPVDTIHYFLREFTEDEYAQVPGLPDSTSVYNLMKKVNGGLADVYSDYIFSIDYVPVNGWQVAIMVTTIAARVDRTYAMNNGFRTTSIGQVVDIRNLNLGT